MTTIRPGAFDGVLSGGGDEPPPIRQVQIIGTGLMGTSLGLALRRRGVAVGLEDAEASNLRVAVSVGAGAAGEPADEPELVVVAVPPAVVGEQVVDALGRFPKATVTDVGSVKSTALADIERRLSVRGSTAWLPRYVGGHPMAGSEQSGPLAAQADLFEGRAWALTPHAQCRAESVADVERLARATHAVPVRLTPAEHDEAVALVSHVPHVTSSVVASLLAVATESHLNLAGQGLRDVTRVAAGDPRMWTQILSANAAPVSGLLRQAARRLDQFAEVLEQLPEADPAAAGTLHRSLELGVAGVRRLPGKHGTQPADFALVPVLLPDRPGALARLFTDVESAGVNIEDVRIDHSPTTPVGLVELAVRTDARARLVQALAEHGWDVHGVGEIPAETDGVHPGTPRAGDTGS